MKLSTLFSIAVLIVLLAVFAGPLEHVVRELNQMHLDGGSLLGLLIALAVFVGVLRFITHEGPRRDK